MEKIQREWSTRIQKVDTASAEKKGRVVFEFAIQRDGSIGQMKLKQSTQEQSLDDVVQDAIHGASPFAALPAKFPGKEITVRFQCDYNQEDPATVIGGKTIEHTKGNSGHSTQN
jgi:TonB family protein